MTKIHNPFLLLIAMVIILLPLDLFSADRIIVKNGQFVNSKTGERFLPIGFNYNRLRPHHENAAVLWHDNFNPKTYNKEMVGAMFDDLAKNRFNVVRVFIDHMDKQYGGISDKEGPGGMSQVYIDNLTDFIKQASKRNIYIIPTLCYIPLIHKNAEFTNYDGPDDLAKVEDMNRHYMLPGRIKRMAIFCTEFLTYLKKELGGDTSAIFSIETMNEAFFIAGKLPFSARKGSFLFNGKNYSLESDNELQNLVDDAFINWQNTIYDAIKVAMPETMVTTSLFTYGAVGRSGPAGMLNDTTADIRTPGRPLALAKSKIDYIDIHLYAQHIDNNSIKKDFYSDIATIEWEKFTALCKKRGIPYIMGEFGAGVHAIPTAPQAAPLLAEQALLAFENGFQGFLMWTYDSVEQNETYIHSKDSGALIFNALSNLRSRISVDKKGEIEIAEEGSVDMGTGSGKLPKNVDWDF